MTESQYKLTLETMFEDATRRVSLKLTISNKNGQNNSPPSPIITESFITDLLEREGYANYFVFHDILPEIIADIQLLHQSPPGFDDNGIARFGTPPVAEARDASASIIVSEDNHEATLKILPAMGGDNLSLENIHALISETGLRHGVDESQVEQAIKEASRLAADNTLTPSPVSVIIAKATRPVKGEDAWFESLVETVSERVLKPKLRDDGTIDMRELGDLPVVVAGTPLMKKHPFTTGTSGVDIFGQPIEAEPGKDFPFNVGDGTEISKSDACLLLSSVEGQPDRIERGMRVSPAVRVNAVDLSTGNIDIDASLIVEGDILDGMTVKSGGNITVGGVIESATVIARGSIMVGKGIVGKKLRGETPEPAYSCRIKAGLEINAVFASYAQLEAKQKIHLDEQLLHCSSKSRLIEVGNTQGQPGHIVGGSLHARQQVITDMLGAPAGIRTIIDLNGLLISTEIEKQITDQACSDTQTKIQNLQKVQLQLTQAENADESKLAKVKNTLDRLTSLLKDLQQKQQQLKEKMTKTTKLIEVIVKKKLYPNIEIMLNKRLFKSSRTMESGRVAIRDGDLKFLPEKFN